MDESIPCRLKSLVFLALGVFAINYALAIYESTCTNFFVNDLDADAFQMGALESIREIPGLLSAFVLGTLLRFPEPLLARLFLLIFGFGMRGVSTVDSWTQVVLWSVVWSIGFLSWGPLSRSITLTLSDPRGEGKRLRQIDSVSSIAGMTAMASVAFFSTFLALRYRVFFVFAGIVSAIGGLMTFRIQPTSASTFKKTRLVFRGRYGVYYVQNFLEGARRQILSTSALFALVKFMA